MEGTKRKNHPHGAGVRQVSPRGRTLREPPSGIGGQGIRCHRRRDRRPHRRGPEHETTRSRRQATRHCGHDPHGIRPPPDCLFGVFVGHGTRPHDDLPRFLEHRERRGRHDPNARPLLFQVLAGRLRVRELRREGLGTDDETRRRRRPPRGGPDGSTAPVPADQVSEGHPHCLHPPGLCPDRGSGRIHQRCESRGRQLPAVVFGRPENAEHYPRSRQLPELPENGRSSCRLAIGRTLVSLGFGQEHRSRLQPSHRQSKGPQQ
mmetsp:Transcript_27370/g.58553  ORF Transcript_27370/g.58553 Transcript_27370/m.58553 type:complete len:262 (-) Transcript_27370:1193-1978(-)